MTIVPKTKGDRIMTPEDSAFLFCGNKYFEYGCTAFQNVVGIYDFSVKGDANLDGTVSLADAVLLQKFLIRTPGSTLPAWISADMNCDGAVNVFDLAVLKNTLG